MPAALVHKHSMPQEFDRAHRSNQAHQEQEGYLLGEGRGWEHS